MCHPCPKNLGWSAYFAQAAKISVLWEHVKTFFILTLAVVRIITFYTVLMSTCFSCHVITITGPSLVMFRLSLCIVIALTIQRDPRRTVYTELLSGPNQPERKFVRRSDGVKFCTQHCPLWSQWKTQRIQVNSRATRLSLCCHMSGREMKRVRKIVFTKPNRLNLCTYKCVQRIIVLHLYLYMLERSIDDLVWIFPK